MLEALKDFNIIYLQLFESIAVIIAAIVAIIGINSWRKELKYKREYELAEEVLALFYETRDVIKEIRNPVSHHTEWENRGWSTGESNEEKWAYDQAYVIEYRYNKNKNTFNKLHSLKYRYMSLYGKENTEPFEKIDQIVNKIFRSVRILPKIWLNEVYQKDEEQRIEELKKHESIVWHSFDSDPISNNVNKIIVEIESTCKNIIQK